MIALADVTISSPLGGEPVVRALTLKMEAGTWNEIIGPAGAGKTALFEVMTLRRRPPGGKLVIAGRNVSRLKKGGLASLRRDLGSCPQEPTLLSGRAVIENVFLPLFVRGARRDSLEEAEETLGFLGLMPQRDLLVEALSEQEQILLGLAMATVGSPKVIVIDGVHERLEPAARGLLMSWLKKRMKKGSTVVLMGRRALNRRDSEATLWRLQDGAVERTGEVDRC